METNKKERKKEKTREGVKDLLPVEAINIQENVVSN